MLALEIAWAAHMMTNMIPATINDFLVLVKNMSPMNALAVVELFDIRSFSVKVPATRVDSHAIEACDTLTLLLESREHLSSLSSRSSS